MPATDSGSARALDSISFTNDRMNDDIAHPIHSQTVFAPVSVLLTVSGTPSLCTESEWGLIPLFFKVHEKSIYPSNISGIGRVVLAQFF